MRLCLEHGRRDDLKTLHPAYFALRFRGYVARSGAVRASVTVQDKYASGSGKLSGASGQGTWSGYSAAPAIGPRSETDLSALLVG